MDNFNLKIPENNTPRRPRVGFVQWAMLLRAEHGLCRRLPGASSPLHHEEPVVTCAGLRIVLFCHGCDGRWSFTSTPADLADVIRFNREHKAKKQAEKKGDAS